jgi:hypothetical protein
MALRPRIGVYTATPSTSSKCETSAATGLPIDTPDTAIAVDCGRSHRTRARTSETTRIIPATLVSGSMFGYVGHEVRREPWPGWTGRAMLKPNSSRTRRARENSRSSG